MKIVAKDRNGKPLEVGQRVCVVVGNPGWSQIGIVTKVRSGSSSFRDEDGGLWQRPNSDFQIKEPKECVDCKKSECPLHCIHLGDKLAAKGIEQNPFPELRCQTMKRQGTY